MACSVDKSLLPMKAHYFLFNAGSAPIVPFLPVYARQLGFSSFVVGTIYAVLPIFGMLSKPLFGAAADYFKQQKTLFLLFQVRLPSTFIAMVKFIMFLYKIVATTFSFSCYQPLLFSPFNFSLKFLQKHLLNYIAIKKLIL